MGFSMIWPSFTIQIWWKPPYGPSSIYRWIFHDFPLYIGCKTSGYWGILHDYGNLHIKHKSLPRCSMYIHVRYIYLQNWVIFGVNVGKYSSTMEHLGYKSISLLACPKDRRFKASTGDSDFATIHHMFPQIIHLEMGFVHIFPWFSILNHPLFRGNLHNGVS